jgi:hypothetical protein
VAKKRSGAGSTLSGVIEGQIEAVQEVHAIPVLVPEPQQGGGLIASIAPRTQAMAVAAGGFVAGAAVVGLAVRRRGKGSRALAKGPRGRSGARRASRAGELVRIVGTRSLLVDVHLLDGAKR